MRHNGCIQLDVSQQTVVFFPHYQIGDFSDPLIISHSLSGPNDKTHLIANMQQAHETYGPGSYEYPLAFCLREALNAGAPAIWAFSSSVQDLFKAVPNVIEEGQYPFCDELKYVYEFLELAALQYLPQPQESEPNINYRSVFASANESASLSAQTQFTAYPDIYISHRGDPRGPAGPSGRVVPKQTKDFRNIGKSHNAQKRW
jgi:hypothetical protein